MWYKNSRLVSFIKSTRFDSEGTIISEFRKKDKIKLKDLFTEASENKNNFIRFDKSKVENSVHTSDFYLENLKTLNKRHTDFIDSALEGVEVNQRNTIKYHQATINGESFINVETEGSVIKVPFTKDESKKFNLLTTQGAQDEFEKKYVTNYLNSTKKMLQDQKVALQDAEVYLREISKNPNKKVTLDEYLKIRSAFTKVKSSVNLRP